MASEENAPFLSYRLGRESLAFGDMLIFNHTNYYRNLALTVLLTFHYLQNQLLPIRYVVKVDADCSINIPLLVKVLHSRRIASRKYLYTGDCMASYYNTVNPEAKNYVPACLVQKDNWIPSYARGGIYVFTYNLLTPLLIASRHLPFIAHNEDVNTGRAMLAMKISCKTINIQWLRRYGCTSVSECREYVAIHPRRSPIETLRYYKSLIEE